LKDPVCEMNIEKEDNIDHMGNITSFVLPHVNWHLRIIQNSLLTTYEKN